MMKLIDEAGSSERRFGVGHFDLIVIDEGAPFRLSQIQGDLQLFRRLSHRPHRDAEGRG
jgi:hypothetical protein